MMGERTIKILSERIYVLCSAGYKTGGTELMHQLVHYLRKGGKETDIVYVGENMVINEAFKDYVSYFITLDDISDDSDNLLIVPETLIYYTRKFKLIKKAIWWLSVDNFTKIEGALNYIRVYGKVHGLSASYKAWREHHLRQMPYVRKCDYHLCQSNYAMEYLDSIGIEPQTVGYLSDYINDIYLTESNGYHENRKDIVLYNPKKGYEITKRLIQMDSNIKWKPLINMSNDQMRYTLLTSKVYVDFGNHPGKDRIPREAAVSGCCVITGKKGSAAYSEDVGIPEEYKFDDVRIKKEDYICILDKIRGCLKDYDKESIKFEDYRKKIKGEKAKFISDISDIFID